MSQPNWRRRQIILGQIRVVSASMAQRELGQAFNLYEKRRYSILDSNTFSKSTYLTLARIDNGKTTLAATAFANEVARASASEKHQFIGDCYHCIYQHSLPVIETVRVAWKASSIRFIVGPCWTCRDTGAIQLYALAGYALTLSLQVGTQFTNHTKIKQDAKYLPDPCTRCIHCGTNRISCQLRTS